MTGFVKAALVAALASTFSAPALAQQQPSTVSNMPFASTPLSGNELMYIVQNGGPRKIALGSLATLPFLLPLPVTTPIAAHCDAQVVYDFILVTAGSGGTRQVTLNGTPAVLPVAGHLIDVGIGGASSGASWQGTVASVSGTTNPVVTVTAAAGTAIGSSTYAVVQWGTDNYSVISAAVAANQGKVPIVIPGQCGVRQRISLTASGADFHGTLGPPGHHDAFVTPWSPPSFTGLVWLGGADTMFNQTSVSGLGNQETKGQTVHDLAFFGGNSATIGRNIATVAGSTAHDLYAADATSANFSWGSGGATSLGEAAGTCFLDEASFTADGILYGGVDFFFTGANVTLPAGTYAFDYCGSNLRNIWGSFSGSDAIDDIFADHNHIDGVNLLANGASTTGYSIHASSIGIGAPQANHYEKVGVGNLSANTQGHIKVEGNATSESFLWVDTFDPPVGWALEIANTNPITCTTDQGADCAAVAIAALPTCAAGLANKRYTINNGVASPTYNAAVSTTGSATDSVVCVTTNSGSTYGWVYR